MRAPIDASDTPAQRLRPPQAGGRRRPSTTALPVRHRLAITLWSVVVLCLAALPLATGYEGGWALAVLPVAVLLAFGLVALGLRLGVSRWAVAIAGAALGIACLMVVLRPVVEADPVPSWRSGTGTLDALAPLLDALPRLLTAPRPAPATPDLLAPTALLVWLVALVVALIIMPVRSARATPLVGAAVLYLGGALLTAGQGDRSGVVALAVVLVIAAGWIALPAGARPEGGQQRRGLLLPTAGAVVAAAVALVAAVLPTAGAFEPRVHVPPPQLPASAANPIPSVSEWNLDADRPLFVVAPRSEPLPERLALATLVDFDGAAWRLEARLRAIGVVDEPQLPPGQRRASTDLVIHVDQLGGAWLPSSGETTMVDGAGPLADVDTGSLVLPEGLQPGQTVTVVGSHDAPTAEEVERAGVPPAAEAGRYLELPGLPEELHAEAAEITAGADSRLAQALALEEAVRAGRLNDLTAQSGSSYGRLLEFLFLPEQESGQIGTAEQFAGAFAVLARDAGLPTRVVVGFDLAEAVDDGATATFEMPGEETTEAGDPVTQGAEATGVIVRGKHATIWPEVYFANAGWVAFQPTPDESTTTPPADAGREPEPEEPEDAPAEQQAGSQQSHQQPPPAPDRQWSDRVPMAALLLAVGVLLLVPPAVAFLRRLARRRRWRAAGARGAWAHVLDALVLRGHPMTAGATAPQLVAELDPALRPDATELARAAEMAAFGPSGAQAATQSSWWSRARTLERSLRAQLPWYRRAWWWLSWRPYRS